MQGSAKLERTVEDELRPDELSRQLHQIERRLHDFLETAADRLWEMDADLRLSYVSPGQQDTMLDAPRMIGRTRWEIAGVAPDCDPLWQAHIADLKARRPFRDFEFRIKGPDGSDRFHAVSGIPIFDSNGVFTGYRGTVRDVTDRKLMEEALRNSEQRLKMAIEGAGAGLFEFDIVNGTVVYNDAAAAMLDYAPDELPGDLSHWIERLHPDDRDATLAKLQRHIDGETELFWSEQRQRTKTGKWLWFACVGRVVERAEDGRARRLIGIRFDITELKQAQKRAEHLAFHDELTSLPNRRYFNNELKRSCVHAKRNRSQVGVMLLDIDHFKDINDTLGHSVGDKLLTEVTRRLRSNVGEGDLIARIGGDEFAIIATGRNGIDCFGELAERLIDVLTPPFMIEGVTVRIGVSIGITIYPEDTMHLERLLANADLALYAAKNAGRHTWRLFDQEMHDRVQARHQLDQELRRALQLGQFRLHYQPLVDLSSMRLKGFEALIRWQHAERGCISPDAFMDIAESGPVIGPLTEWTLKEAMRQGQQWAAMGMGELKIAVNISGITLRRKGIVDLVARGLQATGAKAQNLILEITEGSLIDEAQAVPILNALRKLGATVAVDDFGVGYSSPSRLKTLPVDILKIDRSFIANVTRQPEDSAIAELLIKMGFCLGKEVVAEGVETIEQLKYLSEIGCDHAQGFLFAQPLAADAVPAWVETWRNDRSSKWQAALAGGKTLRRRDLQASFIA